MARRVIAKRMISGRANRVISGRMVGAVLLGLRLDHLIGASNLEDSLQLVLAFALKRDFGLLAKKFGLERVAKREFQQTSNNS